MWTLHLVTRFLAHPDLSYFFAHMLVIEILALALALNLAIPKMPGFHHHVHIRPLCPYRP